MKKRLMGVLAALFVLFGFTACGAAASGAASGGAADQMEIAETIADSPAEGAGIHMPEAPALEETEGETGETSASRPQMRKLIRTVELRMETGEFDALLQAVGEKTEAFGGYTERSDVMGKRADHEGNPILRTASLTVRIPTGRLDEFITELEGKGNIVNRSESTEDVTLQYSDIESRKKTLEMEQDRIWALLEKADTLDAVIALEKRLSEIRYDLESMESQLRLYDNQVEYSILRLDLSEVTTYSPTRPQTIWQRIRTGFMENVRRASGLFSSLFVGIIISVPYWVPAAAILIILYFIGRKYVKKHGEKK